MSVRVEWHHATEATTAVYAHGDDWVGAPEQDSGELALAIATSEVTAIYGTRDELLTWARDVLAALEAGS